MVAEPAAANRYSREFLAVTGVAYTCRYMENPFVLPVQRTAGDELRRYIMQADTGVDTFVFVRGEISRIAQSESDSAASGPLEDAVEFETLLRVARGAFGNVVFAGDESVTALSISTQGLRSNSAGIRLVITVLPGCRNSARGRPASRYCAGRTPCRPSPASAGCRPAIWWHELPNAVGSLCQVRTVRCRRPCWPPPWPRRTSG